MTDSSPSAPTGKKPALWRTFVPSLVILVGTFYFISSACVRNSEPDPYYGYDPCGTASMSGASAVIVEPSEGEVLEQTVADSLVAVPIQLRVEGMVNSSTSACPTGTGHFSLTLRRIAGAGCVTGSALQPAELAQGATEFVFQLSPGSYELTARIVMRDGSSIEPAQSDSVTFVVDGEPLGTDGGLCP